MTMPENLSAKAAQNLSTRLQHNPYPGRGIVLGRSTTRQWVQVYWIMGRSANSRNRVFVENQGCLQTQAADASQIKDPTLIFYNAMREMDGCFIVSNGDHTDTMAQGLEQGKSFAETLFPQAHEPDAPHFTPRIAGCIDLRPPQAKTMLAFIPASPFNPACSEHRFFHYQTIEWGYGYALTTYQGEGHPLPPFEGTPFLVALQGTGTQIAETFWNALNADNKISLAVKTIDPSSKASTLVILNKYKPLGGP